MSIVVIAACLALLGIQLPAEDGQVQPAALHADASLAVAVQQAVAVSIPTQPNEASDGQILLVAASSNSDTPLQRKTREVAELKAEIQQLRTGMGPKPQILVRVEMLEVSLTKLRRMGTDFDPNTLFKSTAEVYSKTKETSPAAEASSSFLSWLKENRIAKALAEPNIVVVSGRPASFFVGGEIPIPNRQDSKAAVEFQKFGTEVDLLAIARDDKHVRLELRARVSEVDEYRSQDVDGTKIPAFTVRQCDTTVEAVFGEPVVLNGLVETRVETVKTGGVTKDMVNEIMLMVIVTPELVDPIDLSEPVLKAPK